MANLGTQNINKRGVLLEGAPQTLMELFFMEIIKNKISGQIIMLNPDQHICPRCKGDGFNSTYDICSELPIYEPVDILECWVCDGNGYVDWAYFLRIGDWQSKDIELDKYLQEEEEEEEYWQEDEDQETGSFIVDK